MIKYPLIPVKMGVCALIGINEKGRSAMRVSYDRLWKLMKNNKMTKRDLAQAAGFSQYMMGQFTKNEYVSLKEIATLCGIFHCDIGDVVEIIED